MESELQAGRKISPELNCSRRWRHKWKPALREVEATEWEQSVLYVAADKWGTLKSDIWFHSNLSGVMVIIAEIKFCFSPFCEGADVCKNREEWMCWNTSERLWAALSVFIDVKHTKHAHTTHPLPGIQEWGEEYKVYMGGMYPTRACRASSVKDPLEYLIRV